MPHLHIKEFKEIETPLEHEGVSFDFIAHNMNHKEEKLIAVKVEDERFFLLAKDEEGRSLLKSDKITRPASTYSLHKALLSYAKAADIAIVSSNVPEKKKNVHLQEVTALKDINYFANNFPQANEIRIEVGFGSGRHLLHQAANNPDILYIGIEIHFASIEQLLKQIAIRKLDNVLILNYDARLFMELVPSNSIKKIYVHFPVPWDKKPHRRVISTSFIKEARRILKIDGTLELRTDSENYYAYAYETFIAFEKIALQIYKNRDIEVSSKYEDRWKKMRKNIYDLTMINEEKSAVLTLEGDFYFSKVNLAEDMIASLYKRIEKFKEGFVHFERVYKLYNGIMLRLAMGSFDKPEHLYLIVRNTEAFYYPAPPLRSKSNLLAHQFLEKTLHG